MGGMNQALSMTVIRYLGTVRPRSRKQLGCWISKVADPVDYLALYPRLGVV